MLDALVVSVPEVAAVHADGKVEVEVEVEAPLTRFFEGAVVEGPLRRRAEAYAPLVQGVDGRTGAS